jgi:hypothetical protein
MQKMQPDGTPYNLLQQNLKRLGTTMLISSLYDVTLALLSLLFSSQIMSLMGLSPPQEQYCFWPLTHLIFPSFCILAWMDTKRNIVIVAGAIIARVVYASFMFAAVLLFRLHPILAVAGGISLLFAATHYVFLRLSDFEFWEVLRRAGNPPSIR